MAYFGIVSVIILGAVLVISCLVCIWVEISERRRVRRLWRRQTRRLFRPRVVQGGKPDAPASQPRVAVPGQAKDKLAG